MRVLLGSLWVLGLGFRLFVCVCVFFFFGGGGGLGFGVETGPGCLEELCPARFRDREMSEPGGSLDPNPGFKNFGFERLGFRV